MSNPVTSKSYGEQLHNGVNFMMSNHITLKKKHIRAKKKLTTNKNARCVGFEHIYMFVWVCLFLFIGCQSLHPCTGNQTETYNIKQCDGEIMKQKSAHSQVGERWNWTALNASHGCAVLLTTPRCRCRSHQPALLPPGEHQQVVSTVSLLVPYTSGQYSEKIFRTHQQAVSIVSLLVPYTSGQYSQILCYKHQQAVSIVSLLVPYTSGQYSEILFYKQQQAMSIYSFIACAIHLRSVQWNNTLSTPTSRVHSFIACAIYLRSNLLWCSFIHIKPFLQCINSNTQLWVKKGNFTHKVPEIKQLNNWWSLFNCAQIHALCTGLGRTTPTHVDICTCFHT